MNVNEETSVNQTHACEQCNYVAKNKRSLKTHIGKKHGAATKALIEKDEESSADEIACPHCDFLPIYRGFIPPWDDQKLKMKNHIEEKHPGRRT